MMPLLAATTFTVSALGVAFVVVCVVGAVYLGRDLFRKKTGLEERMVEDIDMVGELQGWGFKHFAKILSHAVAIDLDGTLKQIQILRERFREGRKAQLDLMDENFWIQLERRMEDDAQRAKIIAKVAQLKDIEDAQDAVSYTHLRAHET